MLRVDEVHDSLRVGHLLGEICARRPATPRSPGAAPRSPRAAGGLDRASRSWAGSCRSPSSASSWRIQFRRASGWTLSCRASCAITGLGFDSRYSRTARSRSSTGYFLVAATAKFLPPGFQDQTWFGSLRKSGGSTGCNGRGQGDMAGLRRGSRGEPREPARQGSQRHLSGKPITAGLHLEARRAQAPARHSDTGGQSPFNVPSSRC